MKYDVVACFNLLFQIFLRDWGKLQRNQDIRSCLYSNPSPPPPPEQGEMIY